MQYQLARDEHGHESIVVIGTFGARTIDGSNPNFRAIVDGVIGDMTEDEFMAMAEPGPAIGNKFAEVTDRVRYVGGQVLFDGDVVDNALTRHMVDKLHNNDPDWRNLLRFMENLSQNPNPKARANLYRWVEHHGVVINPDGLMVGYKGVQDDGTSVHEGYGIIDGEPMTGHLPHKVGSVIEFPRSKVDESATECSVGLHVGTYEYASGFAPQLLTVLVNPRDVVGGGALSDLTWKYRTCRYEVVELAPNEAYEGTSWGYFDDDEEYGGGAFTDDYGGEEGGCDGDWDCDCDDCLGDEDDEYYEGFEGRTFRIKVYGKTVVAVYREGGWLLSSSVNGTLLMDQFEFDRMMEDADDCTEL